MTKTYRPWNVGQDFLLPPSLLDWLPEDHLARFVLEVVDELDLAAIYAPYEKELRGYPPYEPKMMVALLLYAYCVGVTSSRKIERKTREDVAFRVLAANQSPDHSRIAGFRQRHAAQFENLFVQVLQLCREAGLVKLGHVALDGTKLKANASKHKAMSHERMVKEEARLRETVKSLVAQAQAADAEEDARYGKDKRGDELPEELKRAKGRMEKIREAKRALEAEAKAAQERDDEDDDGGPPAPTQELPEHKVAHTAEGKPKPKAQRNFTDPESRIMKTGDGFVQGYNAQAAVDSAHQVIVSQALTNQSPDVEHLPVMVARMAEHLGALPEKLSADAGYFSEENVQWLASLDVDAYLATGRKKHAAADPPSPRGRKPQGITPREEMARKLTTKRGKDVYRMRKAIVEPVFGQVKEARGIRRLMRRGLDAARAEWSFICATHNLLKLYQAA